jgi:hypothetical protein
MNIFSFRADSLQSYFAGGLLPFLGMGATFECFLNPNPFAKQIE